MSIALSLLGFDIRRPWILNGRMRHGSGRKRSDQSKPAYAAAFRDGGLSGHAAVPLVLTVLGAALHFWNAGSLGLQHFDEGSYAMAGRWLATLGQQGHPPQAPQAPGFVPFLAGVFFLLFGIHDFAAIAVSAAAGTLLVTWIYRVGSTWFDPATGVLAALFLATSSYHLIYSRMILTDAVFSLFFWISLVVLFEAFESGNRVWALIGGLLTGLCWNTKYHGFFPLLITGIWCSGLRLAGWRRERTLRLWLEAAAVALLLFFPWILIVAATTGWTEIVKGLWDHSIGQGAGLPRSSPATLYFYLSRWLSLPLLVLAALGLGISLTEPDRRKRFLASALLFLAVSTLFYVSFPRLSLPLVPGVCLLAAVALERFTGWVPIAAGRFWLRLVLGALVLAWQWTGAAAVLQMRTDSYRQAAGYLATFEEPVVSQMSKNFYFYEEADTLEMRRLSPEALDTLEADHASLIVAFDPVLLRLPDLRNWIRRRRGRLRLLRSFRIKQYEPVRFQAIDPWQEPSELPDWAADLRTGEARIEVYRLSR